MTQVTKTPRGHGEYVDYLVDGVHVVSLDGSVNSMFPNNGTYIIRSEAEETERNLALKALIVKYGKAVAGGMGTSFGIWDEIEEVL